jgi:CO dehydrogenase nickel-insertion accessory protein CooC1
MNNVHTSLYGTRIGICGKGGSGKSTFTVLLANALARRNARVCVIDADSTNVGLDRALGIEGGLPNPLIDYFGGMVFHGGAVTCPVDDPTLIEDADIDLDRLPAQFHAANADGVVLLNVGKLGGRGPGAGCDGPLGKIARDLRVTRAGEPYITIVDFKAGLEDSSRGVITSLDWVIVVVDPTPAGIQIAGDMQQLVHDIRAGHLPATAHMERADWVAVAQQMYRQSRLEAATCVMNKVPDRETERQVRRSLRSRDMIPLGVIPVDASIASAWLKGIALDVGPFVDPLTQVIDRLEQMQRKVVESHV